MPCFQGETRLLLRCQSVTFSRCQNHNCGELSGMRIASLVLCRRRSFMGSSVSVAPGSCASSAVKKNRLRSLWPLAPQLLRPKASGGARLILWRPAHLPGAGRATRGLWAVRLSETGATDLAGRQSLLHQALCLFRGSPLSRRNDQGCGQGTAFALGFRQRTGAAVYAGAVAARGHAGTQGDRHR